MYANWTSRAFMQSTWKVTCTRSSRSKGQNQSKMKFFPKIIVIFDSLFLFINICFIANYSIFKFIVLSILSKRKGSARWLKHE